MPHVSLRVPETVAPGLDRIARITLAALTWPSALPRLSRQWRQRASDRRHLSELEDHVLADFGLTRQQVMDEAAKPFWRPLDPGSAR